MSINIKQNLDIYSYCPFASDNIWISICVIHNLKFAVETLNWQDQSEKWRVRKIYCRMCTNETWFMYISKLYCLHVCLFCRMEKHCRGAHQNLTIVL